MTCNVFGGTLNLAQLVLLNYLCLVALPHTTSKSWWKSLQKWALQIIYDDGN